MTTLISELLKKHKFADTKGTDGNGNTALHLAVKNKEFTQNEIIKVLDEILLHKDINVDMKNGSGETVLQLAIAYRMKDVVDFLLKRKANTDSVTHFFIEHEYDKFREVYSSSRRNDDVGEIDREIQRIENEGARFTEWLISRGFDFDCRNDRWQSALCMAIKYNLHHILIVLLKYTKKVFLQYDTSNTTLLHLFLDRNNPEHRTSLNIHWASRRHSADIVKILLDSGVSVEAEDDYFRRTPIEMAITKSADVDVVEILLERITSVNQKNFRGETLFHRAMKNNLSRSKDVMDNNMEILRALTVKGADVNEADRYGMTPLCHAMEEHNLRLVEFLRDNGADFTVTSEDGETLMHFLAQMSDSANISNDTKIELFNILIGNNCSVNVKDKTGMTPLHVAAKCGNTAIVRKLLEHGANVNCINDWDETPLLYMTARNCYAQTDIAELLLEHRADVNAKDIEGFTALLHAGAVRSPSQQTYRMIRFLLKHGADFNARNHAGHSVLNVRLWQDYREDMRASDNDRAEILLKHWIKLDVANLERVNDHDYRAVLGYDKYQRYRQKCLAEIETLKTTFVDSCASIYDFLHKDLNRRRAHVNREKLQELLHSADFEQQFPEYSVLIYSGYNEAVTRKALLEPARKAWLEITKIHLDAVCLDIIFSFMSNSDLLSFIGT